MQNQNVYKAKKIVLNQVTKKIFLYEDVHFSITDFELAKQKEALIQIFSDEAIISYENLICKKKDCTPSAFIHNQNYIKQYYKQQAEFISKNTPVTIKQNKKTSQSNKATFYKDHQNKYTIVLENKVSIIDEEKKIKAISEYASYSEEKQYILLNTVNDISPSIFFVNSALKPTIHLKANKFSWSLNKNKIFATEEVSCSFTKNSNPTYIIGEFAETHSKMDKIILTGNPYFTNQKNCLKNSCSNKIYSKQIDIYTKQQTFEMHGNIYGTFLGGSTP